MRKIINNSYGMSLMESIVVIVIIGIVMLIWRFVSSGHIKIAVINEGHTFVEKVIAQEKLYRLNKHGFLSVARTKESTELQINTFQNKYFSEFSVVVNGTELTVIVYGNDSVKKAKGLRVDGIYKADDNSIKINEHGLEY